MNKQTLTLKKIKKDNLKTLTGTIPLFILFCFACFISFFAIKTAFTTNKNISLNFVSLIFPCIILVPLLSITYTTLRSVKSLNNNNIIIIKEKLKKKKYHIDRHAYNTTNNSTHKERKYTIYTEEHGCFSVSQETYENTQSNGYMYLIFPANTKPFASKNKINFKALIGMYPDFQYELAPELIDKIISYSE